MRAEARLASLLIAAALGACRASPEHHLIPVPEQVEAATGVYVLDAHTTIALGDPDDLEIRGIVERWAEPMRAATGLPLEVADSGSIVVGVDRVSGRESYRLDVSPAGITVAGGGHAGVFYGLQTLSQLMPPGVADGVRRHAPPANAQAGAAPMGPGPGSLTIDAIHVEDAPRFPYRGLHLDVGRHFFGPEFVKRYLDMMARYKLNRFHWHLTEDQGWRIQIDAYPRLTEVGAFRPETQVGHGSEDFQGDGEPHGGFYTKEEIRDIVAYARDRYITIVPEIEMPGHSLAALAAYPELACTEGPFEVAMTWGVFDDVYCPTEKTFAFLETVLDEVVDLFPGEMIHIGGDEAPKIRWEDSEYVQNLMAERGLQDESEVQSWFIRRIARFLKTRGRRLIGWDEILEGGIAPNATVMSWRGTEGGIEAARDGHDVIMTPYSHLYFDYYQSEDHEGEPLAIGGYLPIDTVYAYEPVPEELTAAEATHVLGAQANVWTEYMKTPEQVEYMVFPRMLALAEVVWSMPRRKSFGRFLDRLDWHLRRLDALGITYRSLD